MAVLSLSLRIFVSGGNQIGSLLGVPAKIFNVQGGKVQPLVEGSYVDNEMVIADELRDAIYRRNLLVIRDSDALSIEIYQAYQKRKKLLVMPSVFSLEQSGLMKGAHLTLRNAVIKQFKIGKRDGYINQDAIHFGFASSDAEINYGSNAADLFQRELVKVARSIATSLKGVGKNIGL